MILTVPGIMNPLTLTCMAENVDFLSSLLGQLLTPEWKRQLSDAETH